MNKKYWIAAMHKASSGKLWASVIEVYGSTNLCNVFTDPAITAANLLETRKRAFEVADAWNDSFKANGTNYF